MVLLVDVPGLTDDTRDRLAALTVVSTDDVLRSDPRALALADADFSEEGVRRWRVLATLLQLAPLLSPQEAVTLADAGIETLDALVRRPFSVLRGLLGADAGAATADEADGQHIVDLLLDATTLRHTGVVNGTVRDAEGLPVAGAEVLVGGHTASTDEHGRFRVLRLPLAADVTVHVSHQMHGTKLVRRVRVRRSTALAAVEVVFPRTRRRAPALSELVGDVLPPISSAPTTTRSLRGAPGLDDILLHVDAYANGDVRAVSRFLDFVDGRFVRRTYRVSVADMPPHSRPGRELVRFEAGWVERRPMSGSDIAREVRRRRLLREAQRGALTEVKLRALVERVARDFPRLGN